MIGGLVLILILARILLYLVQYQMKTRKLPPGPFQWPIVGNLIQLAMTKSKHPHKALAEISAKYGDVMSFKLGSHDAVILSSYETMKTMLVAEEFSHSRYEFSFIQDWHDGKDLGIIFGAGSTAKEIRRFTIRNLRDFGFGKANTMEAVMVEELSEIVGLIKDKTAKSKDSIITMDSFFTVSLVNIVWSFMSGSRFKLNDPELHRMVELNEKINGIAAIDNLAILYPSLRFIFKKATGYLRALEIYKENKEFMNGIIVKYRKSLEANGGEPKNFIEVFIKEIEKERGSSDAIFTDEQLLIVLADMFIAGSETTSKSIDYSVLFMMLNQGVQDKVRDEIDSVIPRGQFPSTSDMEKMPYTRATIMEIMRVGNIVPVSPCRKLVKEYVYKDYVLPAGLLVVNNMYPVFMDDKYWGDPQVFRPERFLDSNLNIVNAERLTAFGMGPRSCLGESMARSSIFMYLTTLLQNFEFCPSPNSPLPSTEPRLQFTMGPQAFDVLIKVRNP